MSSRRANIQLAARAVRAFTQAGVVRPVSPRRLALAKRAGQSLHATPAASIAIAAALDPDGPAVADERRRLTWSVLDARVRSIAGALASDFGAGPNGPVAVMCRNHAGAIEAIAAAARTGADVLALNTEFAPPSIAAALGERGAAVVVCDEEFAARLETCAWEGPRVLAWHDTAGTRSDVTLDELAGAGHAVSDPLRRSRIVILTSGTTGVPKGAARDIPLRSLIGSVVTLIDVLGLRRGEPVLVAPPLFHGLGLAFASIAHSLGSPIVLRRRFDAQNTLAAVAQERVATLVAVPVMLARMLDVASAELSTNPPGSLRAVVSAGAPLSAQLAQRFQDVFGEVLADAYGSTEVGFGSIATSADLRAAPGTVGRAPLGGKLAILDEDHRPLPPGVTGHIFVGGDLVFDGYTAGGSKETTAQGLMNTGDIGHLDEHGRLFISGREDDMIISGGENVFPQEVEDALSAHPALRDVAVLGVDDDEFGQRLRAFVVHAPGAEPTVGELIEHLRTRVERYKLPREIVTVTDIPRTPTGKVIRRQLVPPPLDK